MLFSEQVRRLSDALSAVSSAPASDPQLVALLASLHSAGCEQVRNDFGRVTQLAFLLNASSVQEAAGLLLSQMALDGEGGGWRGEGAEQRHVSVTRP